MIEKIDINKIQDFLGKTPSMQPNAAGVPGTNADASLQIEYASLIEKTLETAQTDEEAVRKAQELLQSGQLENPENIRQAAENILRFGI
jgi:hypothetical protein